jgi:uncharacterized protein (TIGR03083 family)
MTLSTEDCLTAITRHSHALADAARVDLHAPVAHCPGWDVADLVRHVADVHRFWGTIAAERLAEPPEEHRPTPLPDDGLVDAFVAGADRMVAVLADADQTAPVWTWYPARQDIGFITRHQVQEAAVHHFDAAHATGADWTVDAAVATDSIEEFLTTSLAEDEDIARIGSTLPGPLTLAATDTGRAWTVSQATPASGLTWAPVDGPVAGGGTVTGPVSDLLLWIYRRAELPTTDPDVVAAFRRLSSTD